MKKLLVILTLFISASFAIYSYSRNSLRVDDINYFFHESKKPLNEKQLLIFHDLFQKNSKIVYETYNVKMPNEFKVNFAETASVFAKITGKNWFTASVYSKENDSFYFQNLAAMIKNKMLSEIISHELCHQMLIKERKNNDKQPENLMIDEAFCLSFSPIMKPAIISKKQKTKYKHFTEFQKAINKKLLSNNKKEIYEAYNLATDWGTFAAKKAGWHKYFLLSVDKNMKEFEKIFSGYRN